MNALQHIAKARNCLAEGRHLLAGGFTEGAGRAAYLAAFHAVHAYFGLQGDDQRIKTHRGASSRFADLARNDSRIDPSFVAFLSRAYLLKDRADYDAVVLLQASDAEQALTEAERMVSAMAGLVETG